MNKLMRAVVAALAGAAFLPAPGSAAAGGYRVVVNPGNPVASLERTELARLFLRKVTSWPDGQPVVVVDQERTSTVRGAFSREIHQRDADAVAAHWQVLVFSGRDTPPRIVKSDGDVLEFVRSHAGAVGYVSDDTPLAGVKAVTVR
jgi:ABC-type phosphate transport system substrate-binding protein